ncbi:hypothetical protein BJF96_g5376 [Verticillium dahliae]|uniref:DUF7888 domain-containing protein n=1 Tax=Verticillium dahliae TaxID=27337 RepID=A0AA45ALS7_VERDA|nr:hypothetical protein BJF96_g5376 [Verticillium dahliae]PNH54291.1 hypothetical protein VD0003_g3223 [Verticillium dahliae]
MQLFATTSLIFALLNSMASGAALPEPAPLPAVGDVNSIIPPSKQETLTGLKGTDGKLTIGPEPVPATTRLAKRAGPIVVVVGIAGTAAAGIIVKMAIEIGAETIKNLGEWNEAREAFTKKTTQEMWDRNPDYAKFPAAACYNKGYTLADPAKIDGLRSAKFELGLLNTEFVPQSVLKFCDPANTRIASYDCMYIQGGNQFKTNSEGGYINLSYTYDPTRCTFEGSGDLTCK